MKTVYEHFLSYMNTLLAEKDAKCKENVVSGIKSFLAEMDLDEKVDPEGRISHRELYRFKMMPIDTFIAFFENYEIRSKILQFRRGCAVLALNRLKTGNIIDESVRYCKLATFYELVSALAVDKRYTSWIDDQARGVKANLAFAAGKSNVISEDLFE